MSFSGRNRLQTNAWGRFVLGVLVLAWLNITAQPCLMAMEITPHAPLAAAQAVHSEHAGHMGNASALANCGHCPPGIDSRENHCVTGSASGCEMFPGYAVDGRQIKLQLKDVFPPPVLLTTENTFDFSAPVMLFLPHDNKRLKFAGDPPLNIRHCIFLK